MKFSETHEWLKVEGDFGIVGITQYAQNELKEIVAVQLPPVGKVLELGEEAAILESTKAAIDIYSPITGEVVAVNEELKKNPNLLNQTPETEGWLFKMRIDDLDELDTLLDLEQYLQLVSVS